MTTPADTNHLPDTDRYRTLLGDRLRLLRLTARLTQDQLAAASGLSRSFISLIEKGTCGIEIGRLLRLAHGLRIPLRELLPADDPDTPTTRTLPPR